MPFQCKKHEKNLRREMSRVPFVPPLRESNALTAHANSAKGTMGPFLGIKLTKGQRSTRIVFRFSENTRRIENGIAGN